MEVLHFKQLLQMGQKVFLELAEREAFFPKLHPLTQFAFIQTDMYMLKSSAENWIVDYSSLCILLLKSSS